MFRRVKLFKCDISKLDVSSVTNMDIMFFDAGRFNQQLCGVDCVRSEKSDVEIFVRSPGWILDDPCPRSTYTFPSTKELR